MTKYFKNVKSLEDLKNQFKALARKNHPDAGGNAETMKEINCEYDALFPIWKDRHNTAEPQNQTTETADSTRRRFYTDWGWEGSRYNSSMSTTEISKAIKIYCKEKYPTWKFSVTSKYFSGGSSIDISVMEAPEQIFDLAACRKAYAEHLENEKMGYYGGRGLGMDIEKMLTDDKMHWQLHRISDHYKEYFTEYGFSVLEDVYKFMQSYNYDDSDSMTDYFACNFYSSFNIGKWDKGFKIVPKTARIKNQDSAPAKKAPKKKPAEPEAIEQKTGYTYKITKGEDTRDGSELWLVRIEETLDREAYKAEAAAMKERGGYYSKFRKAFIFRFDPTEILSGGKAA
ncbi:hypothetical protein SAMN05216521_102071 [Enterocloster clostridioformis]|uniref:Large polyvalent protein associated domain-containing protein n=2 Tax=Enterocloster clostridioformis TaxID=1531 RepID=A0A1I0GLJ0_9FIRM|nr:hypothetical protein SAMN05216521_102071 [Enterocloster clostridioformis]SEW16542.1 hypothetical protein SAMN05216528_101270 [Enterocloster clostridioformis]